MPGNLRNFALWVIIVLLLLALFTLFQNPGSRPSAQTVSFSQLLNEIEQGRVRDLTITGQDVRGNLTDGRHFQSYGPNDQSWIERARHKGVSLTLQPPSGELPGFVSLLASWLPFLALIGVWIFLSRQMKNAAAKPHEGSRAEIEGLKRQIADMQAQIDRLRLGDK